jgi:hypothetical protein
VGEVCKKHIRILIRKENSDRITDYRLMENHPYQCIYDILRSETSEAAKLPALQRYKTKLVRLHARRKEKVMLDNNAHYKMDGGEHSLFHILKIIKRRETRAIRYVQDQQGNTITRPRDILSTFARNMHP